MKATRSSRREFITGPLGLIGLATLAPVLDPGRVLAAEPATPPSSVRFLRAVEGGELDAVRAMLDADPGLVHAKDAAGRSAFALAHLARHPEIGELLVARGHGPDAVESALATDWERFEALAAEAPGLVNRDHPIGGTAMYAAAMGGAGSQIWRVYQFGADPDANPRGEAGVTAVYAALGYPDLATAEMTAATLLGNGADPNAPQAGGDTPLHLAARRGSREMVEMLVRKGAKVDARDGDGHTALERAEAHGHQAVTTMLRRHREIPRDRQTSRTAYDAWGKPWRAPDLAAFDPRVRYRVVGVSHGDLDAVRALVEPHPELAASVATTTEICVEACAHTGRKPIVDYLLEKGAPYSLPTAVMRGDRERVIALLDEDPLRIHERGAHDFALLWYPVIGGGLVEMAELLLERGAEVERQHHLGTTALHWAARRGQLEMVALLLEHGADPNRVARKFNAAGETPLVRAEAGGHDDVVKLLRDRGARS